MKKFLCIIILSFPYLYGDFSLSAPTSTKSSFGAIPTDTIIPSFYKELLDSENPLKSELGDRVAKYTSSGITTGYYNPQPPFLTNTEIISLQNSGSSFANAALAPATLAQAIDNAYATLANYLKTTFTEAQIDGDRASFANMADYFINMDFKIDNTKLITAIQNGLFETVSYDRTILSEYILGKMTIAASIFTQNGFLSNTIQTYGATISSKSDLQIMKDFIHASETYLADTRFLRTLFPAPENYTFSLKPSYNQADAVSTSTSLLPQGGYQSSSTTTSENKLQLLDTLNGMILLGAQASSANPTHVQAGLNLSGQGNQAFIPIEGAMNKWSSTTGNTREIAYTIDNLSAATPPLKLTINNDQLIIDSGFGQTASFSATDLKDFFNYPHQWAPVVAITSTGPVVQAIVKLNSWEFPLLINKNDEKIYENQIIQMPSFLYSLCLPDKDYGIYTGPLAYRILQGLYNGFLISAPNRSWILNNYSSYVNPNTKDCSKFLSDIQKSPGQQYNPGDKPLMGYAQIWYTTPDSPINWKLLRALKTTLAAQKNMYVTHAMFSTLTTIIENPSNASPAQTKNYKFLLKPSK